MVALLWRVNVDTLFIFYVIFKAFISLLPFILASLSLLKCVHVFTVDVLLHDCRRVLMFAKSCVIALTFTAFVSYSSVIVVLC